MSTKVNETSTHYPGNSWNHKESLSVPVVMNPWTFIGLAFAVQVVGSIWVSASLGLTFEEVAWPIALLVLGGMHALLIRFWLSSNYSKWKQHWAPALFYSGFIFLLSNRPFKGIKTTIDANCFHPLEYAALGLFLCWSGHLLLRSGRGRDLVLRVFAGGMAFAALDELHQSLVPGRTASFTDLLLDGIGLAVGIGLFFFTGPLWGAREKSAASS